MGTLAALVAVSTGVFLSTLYLSTFEVFPRWSPLLTLLVPVGYAFFDFFRGRTRLARPVTSETLHEALLNDGRFQRVLSLGELRDASGDIVVSRADLQRLLDHGLYVPEADRLALERDRWSDFLSRRLPPPAWWEPLKRNSWKRALRAAQALSGATSRRAILLVPVWYCDSQDDEPRSDWNAAMLLLFDSTPHAAELVEASFNPALVVRAFVEQVTLGYVVSNRSYAPGVTLPYRNRHFAAVESNRMLTVREIVKTIRPASIPPPRHTVAPFSRRVAIAVEVGELERKEREAIVAAVRSLAVSPAR